MARLKCRTHCTPLISNIKEMVFKETFTDVTLACDEGHTVKVHSLILCASSQYFEELLLSDHQPDKAVIVILKDVTFEHLKILSMYTGQVTVSQDQLNGLMQAAFNLKVKGMMDQEGECKEMAVSCHEGDHQNEEEQSETVYDEETIALEQLAPHKEASDSVSIKALNAGISPIASSSSYSLGGLVEHQLNDEESNDSSSIFEIEQNPMDTDDENNDIEQEIYDEEIIISEHSSLEDVDSSWSSYESSNEEWNGSSSEKLENYSSSNKKNGKDSNPLQTAIVIPGRPFSCERCGRSYKRGALLARHLEYECGIEPRFPCTLCDLRYKQKAHLKKHLKNVHKIENSQQLSNFRAGPKLRPILPFKCDNCERSCKVRGNLTRHMKYECGVSPSFACTRYDYKSKQKRHHKDHLITIHDMDSSQVSLALQKKQ